jgi:hemolysin III
MTVQPDVRAGGRDHPAEIEADFAVHRVGMLVGGIAAAALLAVTAAAAGPTTLEAVLVYTIGLMAMLSLSAAYHFHYESERGELLRRLDHAAIFVMIAGTYTPFTVGILNGAAAVWSTGSMWAAALAGAAVKIAYPRRFEWITIVFYLGLGWAAVVFMRPLLAALDRPTLILIVLGGVVYSVGAGVHSWRRLPFHDAIWHALVLIAAGCHYAAILHGVVLLAPRS